MSGKKSWVSVQIDGKWQLVPKEEYVRPTVNAPYIQPDLAPYRPVAGPEAERFLTDPSNARLIEGRKQHRAYLRNNNFVEVGNEKEAFLKYRGRTRDNHERQSRSFNGDWVRKVKRDN